jgi:uncharacterized protein (TIGR02300 family)
VAKPDLGKKRVCGSCSAPFFDLNRTPVVCPKCKTEFALTTKGNKPSPAKAKPEEDDDEVEDDDEFGDLGDVDVLDDDDDDDLIEDASDLGEDDDDMSEVKEHIDLGIDDDKN